MRLAMPLQQGRSAGLYRNQLDADALKSPRRGPIVRYSVVRQPIAPDFLELAEQRLIDNSRYRIGGKHKFRIRFELVVGENDDRGA